MRKSDFSRRAWGISAVVLALSAIACERQAAANAKLLGKCVAAGCVNSDCRATCTKVGDLCSKDNQADQMAVGSNIDSCDGDASQTCPTTGIGLSTCVTVYQCVCVSGGGNTFVCGKGDKVSEVSSKKCTKP